MGPEHACAIITGADGRLLLQLRPAAARHAAHQLVCFGGKREPGEDADGCLRRELAEELGRVPVLLPGAVDLRRGARWIARFTPACWPPGPGPRTELGFVAVWAPPAALPGLPLSPWHAAVIGAWRRGRCEVLLDP